jgi:hypothetical protein
MLALAEGEEPGSNILHLKIATYPVSLPRRRAR